MAYDLVIKDGTILTASGTYKGDIGVRDEKIAAIGDDLKAEGGKTINAKGCFVMPGGIDVHTHLDMPFGGTTTVDDFASGTLGAICGGTTTIVDFAIQRKGESLFTGLETWHKKAAGNALTDYGFHMILTDLSGHQLKEMGKLAQNEGVPSFKLFTAYPGVFMTDNATLFHAMRRAREVGGLIMMHAESGEVIDILVKEALENGNVEPKFHALTRPVAAEAEATQRCIALAEIAGSPLYIVHMTAGEAVDHVRQARYKGLPVYGETCPQYLYLSHSDYERKGFEGAKFVMSPPLRPIENQDMLWEALWDNTLQTVSTDHCSFNFKHDKKGGLMGKELGKNDFTKIPNGCPAIEYRLQLMWDGVNHGRLSENRFVDLVSTSPAKLFGLYPRKGEIAPGSDADVTVIDPKKPYTFSVKTHHLKVDYNPYEGKTMMGAVKHVLRRGQRMVTDFKPVAKPSKGQFLKRTPFTN